MNSTETPGGSGIPAGWYDDPSGQGLRWWDGEQWTEHVHTAESAAAAAGEAGAGDREAPPPELVKLRESIRAKGAKGVGMVLGGLVLIVVVIALLVSGGSDNNGKAAQPGSATPTAAQPVLKKQIKALRQQLNSPNLPKAEKKALEKELKKLEKKAGGSSNGGKQGKSGKGKGKASKE
ncbi:MAG TPA: DUF2510 domain-containing protein [Solirubrobacterales bacterium]|nr:DUF2510 domain-containing protein [Solirubrobacterales bacterium]